MDDTTALANTPAAPKPTQREQMLALVPPIYKTRHERLAYELALKMDDPPAVFRRHGYDAEQALALCTDKDFGALLDRVQQEVKASGMSFRAKARAMAEDLLPEAYAIAIDDSAGASLRLEILQWLTRVADLEPAPKTKDSAGSGGGMSISITFAGQPTAQVVNGREPLTIEAEK